MCQITPSGRPVMFFMFWAISTVNGTLLLIKTHFSYFDATPDQQKPAGFQILAFSKYYYGRKRQSKFILGPNAVENTHYFKNYFKRKLLSIPFLTKKSVGA